MYPFFQEVHLQFGCAEGALRLSSISIPWYNLLLIFEPDLSRLSNFQVEMR